VTIVHNWKLWCDTEGAFVTIWAEQEPTVCPNDPSGHSIDASKTVVQETTGTEPTTSEGTPVVSLDAPHEDDKRLVVVNFPGSEGSMLYVTGAGDDPNPTPPASGRGDGDMIIFDVADAGESTVELKYNEPVELHDGRLFVPDPSQWDIYDRWDFAVVIAASTVTPNGSGTGNCNVVDAEGNPGAPDATHYIVVPAAGNGAYDIDLDNDAAPVPAGKSQAGYWDVDKDTGEVTASTTPGAARWHLLLVSPRIYIMKNLPMPCHPTGLFDFDAYKAEWIGMGPLWQIDIKINRQSTGPGKAAGWLVLFRGDTT